MSAENTGVRVMLTRVDRMNTVVLITESSWRRAVRLHPQEPGAAPDAASQSTEGTEGCLLASTLEGGYLQDAKQKAYKLNFRFKKTHKKTTTRCRHKVSARRLRRFHRSGDAAGTKQRQIRPTVSSAPSPLHSLIWKTKIALRCPRSGL